MPPTPMHAWLSRFDGAGLLRAQLKIRGAPIAAAVVVRMNLRLVMNDEGGFMIEGLSLMQDSKSYKKAPFLGLPLLFIHNYRKR